MLDRSNPFPGLRCFLSEEDYLFFGRHEQIEDLLRRLRTNRLVAVVGTSGSGKSSLVRAGLLPAALGGGMAQAGSAWEIAVMRPGGSPMAHLARALCEAGLYDADAEDALFHLQATLSRSRNGLIEAVRQSKAAAGSKLLLVVDQFEELFRFNRASATSQEEAIGFVNLLLHATQQADQNVYVVLTMRSDFLGECSQFLGLAEAVNDGEFLIPRMTRDQIQEAIEGPIRVRCAEIAPRLLFRLLNDVEDNQDQLPVLQHALMRTWELWQRSQGNAVTPLDLEHYEATGDMHEALSRHADEIFEAFPSDAHRTVAARIFKALTERGPDGRGIRRPARLDRLVAIADEEELIVHQVIEAYRAPRVTFLMPPATSALDETAVIDISHESLMRVWSRLRGWVDEEAQSARIYHRLQESAVLHAENRADLYHDPDLQIALSWREVSGPTSAWAGQYGGQFDEAMAFLDTSREASEREDKEREVARQRELERARQYAKSQAKVARQFKRFAVGLAVGLFLAVVLTIWAFKLRQEAKWQETAANEQRQVAQEKEQEADRERVVAQNAEENMQRIAARADADKDVAQRENYRSTIKLAESMLQGDVQARYRVAEILWGAQPELRGWEWGHLMARCPLEEWSLQTNQGGLNALAASTDGRFLATAGNDGTVALWDSWTRKELWRRKIGRARTLEIDPRNRFVGVGSAEESLSSFRILDASTGQIVHEAAEKSIADIAFSSSGKNLYVLHAEKMERIGTDTWTRLASVLKPLPILLRDLRLFVDSAGDYVGVHDTSNTGPTRNARKMALLDARDLRSVTDLDPIIPTYVSNLFSLTKPVLHSGHGNIVYSEGPRMFSNSLAPDGTFQFRRDPQIEHHAQIDHLAHDARSETTIVASKDGTVTVRNGDGDRRTLSHGAPISGSALGRDGRFITGGADGLLKCWKPIQLASLAVNTAASPSPASYGLLAFANNGDNLLYRTWETDRHFLFDTGALTFRGFSPPEGGVYGGRFPVIQPGANELVVDRETGLFFYTQSRNGTGFAKTRSIEIARPFSAAFDASGRIMVVANQDPEPAVFDVRSNQRLPVPEARGIGDVSVNPAGTRAALLTGDSLQVWDVATGRLLNRHDWDASSFTAIDEKRGRFNIHGEGMQVKPPAFHPNGELLAFIKESEHSSSLLLWDTTLGKMQASIPGEPGRRLSSCTFSPDGDRLLTACGDAKIRIWDWRIGKEVFALSDVAQTDNVAANPDGVTIAYSGWAPSLRIAKALPWNKLIQRDADFYRAVDDLWTYTVQRPMWTKSQTMQHEDHPELTNKNQAESEKWFRDQMTSMSADEAETLGDIQRRRGQPDKAVAHYARALATRQKLVLADPLKAQLQYRLAALYEKQLAAEAAGDPTKGDAVLQQATEFWQKLVSSGKPNPLSWRYLVDFRPRHSATIVAAQAAGQCKDQPLDDAAKAKLCRQTVDALKADLTDWGKILESGPSEARPVIVRTLSTWQQGTDLAGIRDAAALAKLPTEDQKACTELWADVGALLKKSAEPANNADRLRLAQLAYTRKQFSVATRYFAEALASDPKLGDDPQTQHRYNAACAAAQLAAGQGEDKQPLDDGAKAKLRGQALDWLKAELKAWSKLLESGPSEARQFIVQTLSQWQQDSDLVSIRDAAAIANLLPDERAAFIQLWADVAKLQKEANAKVGANLLQRLPDARRSLPKDSPQLAGILAQISLALLEAKQWAEAEPLLRECLAIREKKEPEDWRTFNTMSMLGGSLLGQKKYADAEPLLLKGYQGMKKREKAIPPQAKDRIPEALDRLIELSAATNKPDDVKKWQAERAK